MKPIIGITCDYEHKTKNSKLYEDYYRAISMTGGLPILLPGNSTSDISRILEIVDGVLLTGGDDVDPSFFGESPHVKLGNINPYRDEFEMELARRTMDIGIPILGICRGAQIMNVAMEGSLYQDIESQFKGVSIKHRQKAPGWYGAHDLILDRDSKLYDIVGQATIKINSFHHQAIKDVAPGFKTSGYAPDEVIEAIEKEDHIFAIGLQWHPERMMERYAHSQPIFRRFVELAKQNKI